MSVRYDGMPVPKSPFNVNVAPTFDATAVKVTGEGVGNSVAASLPTQFLVDTHEAGDADLDIRILVSYFLFLFAPALQ